MSYTQEEINLITLSSFNFSYGQKLKLLNGFKSSRPDFENNGQLLIKTACGGVYNNVETAFSSPAYRERVLGELEENGVKCVTYFSQSYPEMLRDIDEPPVLLYCKGDVSLLNTDCFSIVGSRKTLPKPLEICARLAGELSEKFTIVSGGAEGADAKAAESALSKGGKSIAVVAGGLDKLYPPSNASLFKKLQKEGLIVTEHPLGVKPKPYYFPFRNRIIAGLSRGTLVVSAAERSGTAITARYAYEYGREIFALPYSVGIKTGEGCNALIKKGATLTTNVLDIFGAFGLEFERRETIRLSGDERRVYELIKDKDEMLAYAVAEKLNKSVPEISAILTSLCIKGVIVSLGGNRYTVTE